ncbi:MAG TPA: sulfite exporter TauE/SafE family protein [Balneolales bacterium]|nr:sulfite exporter TauE/SafE family protein [Balneolales bacterium]
MRQNTAGKVERKKEPESNIHRLKINAGLLLFFVPVGLTYLIWFLYMEFAHSWYLFLHNWFMSVTMVVGSFVAGASSEGGGAVAFPAMTLIFHIPPAVARNFSLAIQSIGMTSASLWIIAKRIPIETTYMKWVAVGGVAGMIFGTYYVAPLVPPAYAKMMFVSFWLSFGIALYVINHIHKRDTVDILPSLNKRQQSELIFIGIIGGILSAVFGSGIDICSFSFVTMKYHLSEKIATPTSVILMTSNAVLGLVLHMFFLHDMQTAAISYWLVCIPVVLIGAPLGAWVISNLHRMTIAIGLYIIIIVQFIGAVLIIKPNGNMILFSAGIFLLGLLLFFVLTQKSRIRTAKQVD